MAKIEMKFSEKKIRSRERAMVGVTVVNEFDRWAGGGGVKIFSL